ncbi:MAG: RdgB/HAM1 family non-canonical purine NTP pyrophosphatase [Oscillospiraceae bacterium]|jgi:XTP/dITP diphosphohydrolase|nr:RdgB/HAM1 family non-canonical purine NTP pyrophosphatase [Oscillospiraceae bacterium]
MVLLTRFLDWTAIDLTFLLATKNQDKCAELQRLLAPLGIKVIAPMDLPFDLPDVEETGQTFAENARLKAASGCAASRMPCIGDDSGLCVDALNGAPGVCSARFAGGHGDDNANIAKLLRMMEGIPEKDRTARFVCSICCVFPRGKACATEGCCEGRIGFAPKGENGFGYDPVFIPYASPLKTMAELSDAQKDTISHRQMALKQFAALLMDIQS